MLYIHPSPEPVISIVSHLSSGASSVLMASRKPSKPSTHRVIRVSPLTLAGRPPEDAASDDGGASDGDDGCAGEDGDAGNDGGAGDDGGGGDDDDGGADEWRRW